MKFTKTALTLLCSTLLFCGCVKDNTVVLKINDESITKSEFYSDFNKIKNAQFKGAPKEFRKDNSYPALILKDRFVSDVITRTLLSQEFAKRKIEADLKEIDAKKQATIKQIGSEEQLKKILKENNISEQKFNDDMALEVKIEKLVDAIGNTKTTEKDAQAFYNKNKEQFKIPEKVQVSHILIDTTAETLRRQITDADKKGALSAAEIEQKVNAEVLRKEALAKEVREKAIKNPDSFAQLAKEYSEDKETAQKGGDLGYIQKGQMVPEFEKAAFSQKVGVVGPIVFSQYGQHIILVKDKSAAGVQSFAKVKDDIIRFLSQQKKSEILRKYIEGLKKNAKIEYVDPSLNPENIKKQADEALKIQLEQEKKALEKKNQQTPEQPKEPQK